MTNHREALRELIATLMKILLENPEERGMTIKSFQQRVWDTSDFGHPEIEEVLRSLAHDLEYYDSNFDGTKELDGFYGENRLRDEIESGIQKLREYMKDWST